jgi:hypothetical protein
MATYREIKGLTVPYLDSDLPSASASTQEGGVWYNSATGKLRAFISYDTWASGASMSNVTRGAAGGGTQTAAFSAGNYPAAARTEEYNGSGWAAGGDINTPRGYMSGMGTLTAGLICGGTPPNKDETEEYDGSSWTESGDLNTAAAYHTTSGTQTAGLCIGGSRPSRSKALI